jgi:hypothetical protein
MWSIVVKIDVFRCLEAALLAAVNSFQLFQSPEPSMKKSPTQIAKIQQQQQRQRAKTLERSLLVLTWICLKKIFGQEVSSTE